MLKRILLHICFYVIIITCDAQNMPGKRPNPCWVRRSVLDGKPRIISLMLDKQFFVAYDGQSGSIFKIWKDGIDFTGAVFNSKHGPQPVSIGKLYTENSLDEKCWRAFKNGVEVPVLVQFKGYYWKNDVVKLKIELTIENKQYAIEEIPEVYFNPSGLALFERNITCSTLPDDLELYMVTVYDKLDRPDALVINSDKKLVSKTEYFNQEKKLYQLINWIKLKSNSNILIRATFNPSVL